MNTEETKAIAAAKAGMDEKTARKYIRLDKLPSECKEGHAWRTRQDPFEDSWDKITQMLDINPGFEAKTIFEALQREHPGKYADGQLRTLQRHIKIWRATEGPPKEVFFPQKHYPGQLCASDFTDMSSLGITIDKERFKHLIYHFVLTYSNWETGTICFSESFESLSEGLQNALWDLGCVPLKHRTDRLTAAVHKECNAAEFTLRYKELLVHYKLQGEKTQANSANENGDVEQRHYRFKKALEQSLLLRGRRDFKSRDEYNEFLKRLFSQLNAGRQKRFQEELKVLRRLPEKKLHQCKKNKVKVGPSSTVHISRNTYSVDSRLIGEWVEARIYAQHIEIWYAQKQVDSFPRFRGEKKHRIQYRHIIDWLIRKPGAFENYRFKPDLFPGSCFRIAYDCLKRRDPVRANKEYLKILYLSAKEGQADVEAALRQTFSEEKEVCAESVERIIKSGKLIEQVQDVTIDAVNLTTYDDLLSVGEEAVING
ncbi:IS21 family transposase [Candidatus Pacearchaeota archaeon]|nr:IS21 family transposase [Candidatus Pacearchaeota archaeon]